MSSGDTIVALSSGPGRAAIAVIRVSGPDAGRALALTAGPAPTPRRASLRALRDPDTGDLIDRALVLRFAAPASATAEDLVEFHCHGGPAVVARLIAVLTALPGFRLAEPGEFTRRSLAGGRMDLSEVEGLADLIEAETEAQRRQAVHQADGALARAAEGWRARALAILASLEAAIDFADEELPDGLIGESLDAARRLAAELDAAARAGMRGEQVRRGLSVVLLGPPNSGKSSILNSIAGRDAAIVTPVPGTTRDIVEVTLDLAGLPVRIADTAGLRASDDAVEIEGMRRAREHAVAADLVILVRDASRPSAAGEPIASGADMVELWNKIDLAAAPPDALGVSALTGAGMDKLIALLGQKAAEVALPEPPLVTRARQRQCVAEAAACFARAADAPECGIGAEEMRAGLQALGRLVGRVDVEEVLDLIFSRFCIGK